MSPSPSDAPPQPPWTPRRLASFHPTRAAEPLLRDWLQPSRDALFRWTMAMATSAEGRRAIAEMAVAIQRLRGPAEFGVWLYAAALQAALHQEGSLPEASLAGLPPELRALLRLVARRALRREEAMALLAQRMGFVRSRLVQTRLAGQGAAPPLLDHWPRRPGAHQSV
ncbi:MAG: hypothetical protein V4795_15325 [Pseudomonadota bacterium]